MDQALLKGLQTSVPGRYARALYEVAAEQKQTALILKNLLDFSQSCDDDEYILKSLPHFSETDFTAFIENIAKTLAWPQYLTHFFHILYREKRLPFFQQIAAIFESSCNYADGVLNTTIKMPSMPTMSQRKKIEAQVVSIFGKKINYKYESIPDLLGGAIVQVDNLQIDASLKTQINNLKKNLHDIPQNIPLKGAA
jgi:F-type H+-transporting ATPase subunit delta